MNDSRRCPACQNEMPLETPAGLCPHCLLKAGLDSQATVDDPNGAKRTPISDFVPPAPEELAARLGHLEILELIGRGGMGAVYKARQPALDRLVAVKILPAEALRNAAFAERFTREARALAKLSHPHLVAVYEFGQTEGLYYFVMEYVEGVNLRQAMKAGGIAPGQALELVGQICDALQFAHDEGVVHRDIKPENILLDKRGRIKIADFGLVKLMGQDAPEEALTGTAQVMGTWRYMAPEQMGGSRAVDHRADIYSLGVVFYELLTGELPIGRFAPPSKKVQIDVRLDEVVLRALESEPSQRYQNASDVKTSVEKITATGGVPIAASPSLIPNKVPARHYFKTLGLAGLVWFSFLLLWNAREIGVAIACVLTAGFLVWNARRTARFLPATAAVWSRRSIWARGYTNVQAFVFALIGTYAIFLASYQTWERLHWNFFARTSDEFRSEYKGVEHRLLSRLKEFANDTPRAELVQDKGEGGFGPNFNTVAPPTVGNFSTPGIAMFFTLGIWLVFGTYFTALSDKTGLGIGWNPYGWPSVGLAAVSVVPIALLGFALMLGDVNSPDRYSSSGSIITSRDTLPGAMEHLEAWASANGYLVGEESSWKIYGIPHSKDLASVEVRHLWQGDVFDRWQMTLLGLRRRGTDLAVEVVGNDRAKAAVFSVSSRHRGGIGHVEIQETIGDLGRAVDGGTK